MFFFNIINESSQRNHNDLFTNEYQFTFLYVEDHNVYISAVLNLRIIKEKFAILDTFVFLYC